MKNFYKAIILLLVSMSLLCLFGCSGENKEVTLRVVSTFSEDMYVSEDGTVGHTTSDEYTVTVKKGEAIIDGIATLKSVSDDKITVELDKYFISYNAEKPGGKHTIKKGENLSFLMDGLLDATESYTIYFE